MRRMMVGSLALVLAAGATARAELKVGDAAPDFEVKGSDGKTYKLADFKGKSPIVIAWFPKAFTGGCTKECKSFKDNSAAMKGLNIGYFTASVDTPKVNSDFAKSLELDYPILSDDSKKMAEAFGVINKDRGMPNRWTFYIDKEGVVRHIDKTVKTDSHGADVVAKVKELGLAK